jgi:putative transposase
MVGVGGCRDDAVVERFFGSLKHGWIWKAHQPTRKHMKNYVAAHMLNYNIDRLHSANEDLSPMKFELSEFNVSTTT